ncbi:MAG: YitT family protein [Vicinamibacterales bacterium]
MNRFVGVAGNIGLIVLGVLSAGMGLKGFLQSSNFIDGGVTGVSMLLGKSTSVPLAVWLPMVNLPFIAVGYRQMGRAFALKSTLAIAGLVAAIVLIPYPDVTHDLVLTAVFGGFFIGAGIGLAIRGGAVLDGTEIAALLISRRGDLLRVGDVILIFNVVLFLLAMAVLGVNEALYSILTYVAATQTLDFVLYVIDQYTAMTIVSDHNEAIRALVLEDLGRGVTVYRGFGGLSGTERNILYCVVTRLEVGKVKRIVRDADPHAFVVYHPLSGAEGGIVKQRVH